MKKIILLALFFISCNSYAYKDCDRPVKRLWSGDSPNKIYVTYTDGFADAGMKLEYVNNDEQIVSRTLSIIMAGAMGGKSIRFRYSEGTDESAATCTPTVDQKLIGAWLIISE